MKYIKKILISILVVFIIGHLIQFSSRIIKLKPLGGVINKIEFPGLSASSWLSGSFQDSVNTWVDQEFGFKPIYIRIYNQIDFSLYGVSHGDAVVVGKDNFLFEEWYVMEYLGYYNIGSEKVKDQINKLQAINDYLNTYNTKLVAILAPGKPYYYPEHMPSTPEQLNASSNYHDFVNVLETHDIPWIDINKWFITAKDTTAYPLFSKTGTHWSIYGANLVGDSLIKFSQHLLQRPMNGVKFEELKSRSDSKTTDTDLLDLSNLLFTINELNLRYPVLKLDTIVSKEESPNRVVISDSFFWNLYNIQSNYSYNNTMFWYYYNSVFPQWENHRPTVKDLNVLEELKKTDLVFIIVTTAGLHKFGYGFIEDVYEKIQLQTETPSDISGKN